MANELVGTKAIRGLRHVNDYLVILQAEDERKKGGLQRLAVSVFEGCALGLSFTLEIPVGG